MLTSKQRSNLRAMANNIEAIMQIGKSGIDENVIKQVNDAVNAREIVKITVLENSPIISRDACDKICNEIDAEPVQIIGRKFVIYKRNKEKPIINI